MIYVLLLQENKIYVGYSDRPIGVRFIEHFNYKGSKWTTLYRPLQVLQVLPGGKELENQVTLRMMDKYGWWNVRGGSWCQVELSSCPPALLEWQQIKLPTPLKERNVYKKTCSRCGRDTHNARDCYAKTHANGQYLSESDSDTDDDACFRCGRDSHFASDCYAKTHVKGYYL